MWRILSPVIHHPWLTVLGWLCLVALINVAGRVVHPPGSSPSFLPDSAESQRAAAVDRAKFTGGHQSVQLVVVDSNSLQASDRVLAERLGDWLRGRPKSADILSASPPQPSPDDKALVSQITFGSSGPAPDGPDPRIAGIEQHLAGLRLPPGVRVALTGDLAISHDVNTGILGSGSSGHADLFRALSVLVVVVVLGLVYRAPLAVLVPLSSIALAVAASAPLLDIGSSKVGLPVSSNSLPFVFVVILGAGTNWGLFLISRYREELRRGRDRVAALEAASRRIAPAVTASAATVVLGTAAMGFTSLGFFRTLGPAVAVSIVLMLAAALTLTPALIAITKGAFFWPRRPEPIVGGGDLASLVWGRIGALVTRRPALVLGVVLALLAAPVLALAGLQVSVDTLGELPAGSPSLTGYGLIQAHFPVQDRAASIFVRTGGPRLQPDGAPLSRLGESLRAVHGIASVGGPAVSSDGSTARFDLGFRDEPASEAAAVTVTAAETAARRSLAASGLYDTQVISGGEVAADRDLRQLLTQDFLRVMVLVGLAIYLVVAVLVRNLFAPIYLLASVGLSTAAAIGGVGLLYWQLVHQPLYWAVPVFAFVFLVALGEDFNIYLVSRLCEQFAASDGPAPVARAIRLTGGVISSAGLVMAAAFFLFLGNPVPLVQQLGAVVVAGLLLDTFVVRPFLVPALVQVLGRRSGIREVRA